MTIKWSQLTINSFLVDPHSMVLLSLTVRKKKVLEQFKPKSYVLDPIPTKICKLEQCVDVLASPITRAFPNTSKVLFDHMYLKLEN